MGYVLTSRKAQNPFLVKKKYDSYVYLTQKDFMRVKPTMDTFISVVSKEMNKNNAKVAPYSAPAKKVAKK